jgi:glycosyltransferase involved in cell wall biosynthesis
MGAGTEDAEMFLRLGAAGWGAQYLPSEAHSLFVHTVVEGIHSGRYGDNHEDIFADWTAWHPWTRDGKHPFASVATPANGISHPIHSYDDTLVSVIIPVGPGHEGNVVDALDSLEAQTFRGWEAIVVWDCERPPSRFLQDTYPYVNWQIVTPGGFGAGIARNLGVSVARSPLIAFLDADDYYHTDFLDTCVKSFVEDNAIIYTDYVSVLPGDTGQQPGMAKLRDRPDGSILASARFGDFDESKAMARPNGDRPYVWSGITILIPKAWHKEVVGFDEKMDTWEDCDYLLRLAWAGFPFRRISEPLWIYSFVSGKRRLASEGNEGKLMERLQEKYDAIVLGSDVEEEVDVLRQ